MQKNAESVSVLLKSLSHPHRLMLVCRLVEGECPVGDLAEFLGLRDSTVSQHLALLRKDGLVAARREAQTVWYSIRDPAVRRIVECLHEIYCADPEKGK